MDKFGEIGKRLLLQFYEQYILKTLTTDSIDGDFDITPELKEIETLTAKQREFLLSVIEQLRSDHVKLMKSLRGLSKEDLLKKLHDGLLIRNKNHEFDSNKVSVSIVPGGIGLLVHDQAYFEQTFPNSESTEGFYRRGEKYSYSANFPGRIFVVDTTNPGNIATFRHEYLHLLTDNYIEPYEISSNLPDDAVPIQKKLINLKNVSLKLMRK